MINELIRKSFFRNPLLRRCEFIKEKSFLKSTYKTTQTTTLSIKFKKKEKKWTKKKNVIRLRGFYFFSSYIPTLVVIFWIDFSTCKIITEGLYSIIKERGSKNICCSDEQRMRESRDGCCFCCLTHTHFKPANSQKEPMLNRVIDEMGGDWNHVCQVPDAWYK